MKFSAFVSVAALTVGMAAFASGNAEAGSVVDISSLTNSNIQVYTDGTNYPLGGSTVTVNGVNFLLTTDQGVSGTTGVMRTSGSGTTFSPISVNQGDVTKVYTLINSAYGSYGYCGFVDVHRRGELQCYLQFGRGHEYPRPL